MIKKVSTFLLIFVTAGLLLWAFSFFSVAIGAPAAVDLVARKADFPDPVVAGNVLTYTLTVTNSGDTATNGTVITDTLPPGVSFISATGGGCNYDSVTRRVRCNVGNMGINESALRTISVRVDPSTRGTITNTAIVSSNQTEVITTNNTTHATTGINAAASLGLRKSDGISQIAAGDGVTHTYAITVTNAGPSLATGVVVTDTWPASFTRGAVSRSQGTCNISNPTNFTCALGSILPTSQGAITVTYRVPLGTATGFYTNTVRSSSVESTAPITATDVNHVVAGVASLGIAKNDAISQITAGDGITHTYRITVTNSGPLIASGVVVTDTWPTNFTRGLTTPSQGTCSPQSGPTNFICAVGDIAPGGQRVITVPYRVLPEVPAGVYTNTVRSSFVGAIAPITATDANHVVASADMRIAKDDGVSQVLAGDGIAYTYHITVTNGGPSLASGVVVTDTWPISFTRGTVSLSPGTCNTQTSPTNFTCAVGDLLPGVQRVILATYHVPPEALPGTHTNTVQVKSLVGDASTGNNTATKNTLVTTLADVGLSKLDNPDPVNSGELLTYTLTVTNTGPSDARGVIISDTLPTGLTFDSANSSSLCASVGSIVTCNVGRVVAHSNRQVMIKAIVSLSSATTITNHASITSVTTPDPDTSDHQAQASTTVDVGNPVVNWVAPGPNDSYRYVICQPVCQSIHFEVTATDDVGVQQVIFRRWDHVNLLWITIGTDTSQPYTREFDPSVLPLGYNQIWVWAYDTLNHQSVGKRIFLVKLDSIYLPVLLK